MSNTLSRDQFVAQWSASSLGDLRDACKQLGHTLKAKTKHDAVEEAWHLYAGKLAGDNAEPRPELVSPTEELPAGPVQLEGRSKCGRNFMRAGVCFTPSWQPVELTPEQLEAVRKEPMVQVRVKA